LESGWEQKLARKISSSGHEVESHSYNHADFTGLGMGDMRWQLQKTAELIEMATGKRPKFFRPPYGSVNWDVKSASKREGLQVVNWAIDTNDWAGGAWNTANLIGEYHGNGGPIILQHDRNFDEEAQDAALRTARRRGYIPVTLSECLSGKVNTVAVENERKEEEQPGNNKKPQKPVVRTPVRLPGEGKVLWLNLSFDEWLSTSDDKFAENSSWWRKPEDPGKLNPDNVCQVEYEESLSQDSTIEKINEFEANHKENPLSEEESISEGEYKAITK
jgi:hypothetical protein